MAILAKPELTGKDGNSGVMSHTFLMGFFRWEEPQDTMQRNIRRNTLLHGLILHRLKTLLNQKKKVYPAKGYANSQERKESGTCVVGKPLHVKGRNKIISERKKSHSNLRLYMLKFLLIPILEEQPAAIAQVGFMASSARGRRGREAGLPPSQCLPGPAPRPFPCVSL